MLLELAAGVHSPARGPQCGMQPILFCRIWVGERRDREQTPHSERERSGVSRPVFCRDPAIPSPTTHLTATRAVALWCQPFRRSSGEDGQSRQPALPHFCPTAMAGGGQGVPTFVMLQLDVITARGREVAAPAELRRDLAELASMGVAGVMVDVWWGIVERDAPKEYEWGAYRDLFRMVADAGLRIHPVLSFHACGHDVGDSASVPLPAWVRNAAEDEDGILYEEDASRHANGDVVSVGADDLPYLGGRTGLGVVRDFMAAFAAAFADMLGTTIVEIQVRGAAAAGFAAERPHADATRLASAPAASCGTPATRSPSGSFPASACCPCGTR